MSHVENLIERLMTEDDLPLAAFVLSTSTAFDLLEQWRGYGQSSVAVALAFDDQLLTRVLEQQGMRREPCVYRKDEKDARIISLIDSGTSRRARMQAAMDSNDNEGLRHQTWKGIGYSYASDMANFMRQQALTFKDERFRNEAEVRFISDFPDVGSQLGGIGWPSADGSLPTRAYRRRGSAIMPYVKLKLSVNSPVPDKGFIQFEHPLVGVLLGPNTEPQILTQESRSRFAEWIASFKRESPLTSHKLLVAATEVPLRA
jgi:hypothetical protein